MPLAPFATPSERRASVNRMPNGTAAGVAARRALAARALPRMYRPEHRLFAFTEKPSRQGLHRDGVSARYSAIALIGLDAERRSGGSAIFDEIETGRVMERLLEDVAHAPNLGDAALVAWAACAHDRTDRRSAWERVIAFAPERAVHPVVDLAWTLAALCLDEDAGPEALRDQVADRLLYAFDERSSLFPHVVDGPRTLRSHVCCFADAVYPIHALALYSALTGNRRALTVASRCAAHICELQGTAGQWWWHYDRRTGRVIERYPVYAIHQDAMAPMALFAVDAAGGPAFDRAVERGLAWLQSTPELNGGSLVDEAAGTIWRKVARREPRKAVRALQAGASGLHPSLRVPALDLLFPPAVVDYEDRPYHWGWLLYAWAGRYRAQS